MSMVSPKHKLGLALILVLAVLRFVVVPWFEWATSQTASIEQLQRSIQRFDDIQQRFTELNAQQEQLTAGLNQLSQLTAGLDMHSSSDVLRMIESQAEQHHVQLRTRMPGEARTDPVPHIPVVINGQASPANILAMINALEQGQPKVVITELRLRKAGLSAVQLNMNMNLMVLVHANDWSPQ